MPIDVQMPDGTIISGVPDNVTQADLLKRYQAYKPAQTTGNLTGAVPDELGRYDVAKQPTQTAQQPPVDAGFSAKDTAIALGQGVVGAGKSLADVFGAENVASKALGDISKGLAEQYTPERKAEMARREAIQKQASKGTVSDEIGAFLSGVAEAPVQSLAQGLGSIVPYVGTGIIGGIAKLGGATVKAINTVLGTAQGAGAVKGSLYDGVKQELEKSGMNSKEAADKASKAQEYLGENFLDIAGGALLGAAGARVGVESMLTPGAAAKLDARLLSRMGKAALAEAPLEGAQGGQEQLAINRALQKQGFDVGTFEGVAGAAARDAAIGALTGAAVGVRGPGAEVPEVKPPEEVPPETPPETPPTQIAPVETQPATVKPPVATTTPEPTVTPTDDNIIGYYVDPNTGTVDGVKLGGPQNKIINARTGEPIDERGQGSLVLGSKPPETQGNVWESIQNRDRSTPASVAQMAKIANEPDYSRVSMSRDYGTGAPIVAGNKIDNSQLGRIDTVTGSDGKKVNIQYGVVDANDVIASHNADGTKNPEYVDPSITAFRAITNGRVAGLQAAYRQGTANEYKNALLNDDLHAIDKKVIEGMKNPMLVRVMPMSEVNQNTGDISNTGAGLSFNVVEQAKNDTNRVDLSTVQFNESGDVSPQTVRDFIKAMPDTERGNLIDKDGNPTKQAVDRLNAAIFQQAYGNDKLTELGFQAQDEEARNIIRGLNVAAAKAIRLGEAGDYDVRPLVNEAVEMAINARRNNLSLQDAAKQVDITTNPLANQIVQMFADNPRSAKAIGENLSNLFDNAYTEASKSGQDMFGEVPKRPIDQLINESFAKEKTPDLFATPNEPVQIEQPEPKEFQIKKSMEQIAEEIGKMDKGSQVTDWLIDNAPNSAAKAIAEILKRNITALENAGVPVRIKVLNGRERFGYYGMSSPIAKNGQISHFLVRYNGVDENGKATVWPPSRKPTGTRYSTIMHELLHVISQTSLDVLIKKNFKGPEKAIQNDLRSIYRAVKAEVDKQNKLPKDQRHPAVERSSLWLKNVDELWVRALTESDFQNFLSTINIGKKSALTKLMEIFRKVIGLDPKYQSALDSIMLVSDKIFALTPQDMQRLAKHNQWKFIGMPEDSKEEVDNTSKPVESRNYKGEPVKAAWAFPEDKFISIPGVTDISVNNLIYKFQDKQIDTKRAQEAILKSAGIITDDVNAYEKEQLFHGKVATAIREYLLNELLPAIKKLKELNIKPQEMQEYLLARHAKERNDKMNELNKLDPRTGEERTTPWELQDRASGMSTDKAKEILDNLDPAKKANLETVAKMFDKMVTGTQKILVDSGADSQDTIDAWNETYKHYVPLFRVEEDFINGMGTSGISKGFNVSGGFSKRAMGSEKEVQDIIGNLIKQRERALIRAEKLAVSKALYGLFLMNPNPDVALPVNPDAIKSKDALIKELESLGYDNPEEIANNLMEEPKSRYISKEKRVIDKNTGLPTADTPESVRLKINNLDRFGPNVITLRIDGKNRYIFFNQKNPDALRMAQSLKSLDVESLGTLTSLVSKATRWFASVNTQYNPIFAAVNLIRDVGGAQFNLTTTPLAGKQAQVTAGIFPAMSGIFKVLRAERKGEVGGNSDMEKAFREFRKEGGQTGYRDSLARKESEKSIVDEQLEKITVGGNAKKAFKAVFGALSDFNDTLENAIRLSAYLAASKPKSEGGLGLSKQQSAIIAKNLTVNFDKKGQLSANINALYAFFNASVQGTARLAKTLKGPKGKAIIGGGVLLGSMQAVLLAAAGFRDDEPPEFVKERNFIIPTPDGNYLSIPYPLGLHILPSLGRLTTEFVLTGGKNPTKKVGDLMGVFADGLSPLGSAGPLQTIAPTVLDPMAALAENKDAFGRPIYKQDRATNPTPGYMRSRESSSEISKQISYFLNMASGGGKYSKGLISPTADEIDYVAGQVTGGVGRELMKTGQTLKAASTGEDLPAYRIPLAGRFYGETQSNAAESQRFYANVTKMADYENEIKGRIKNKEPVGAYLRDNPQARLWQTANNTENQINALNKQKKEFIERGLPKDRIQRIENQKAAIMKRFNDQVAKLED